MDLDMFEHQRAVLMNVFQFPLLSSDECQKLTNIVQNNRYNFPNNGSMQKHTVDITLLLSDFIQKYMPGIISKINILYDFGMPVDYNVYAAHAIIYSTTNGERALSAHTDDSDITVNIPIYMNQMLGSDLRFIGTAPPYGNSVCIEHFERGRVRHSHAVNSISHQLGSYILHRGDHPHETSAIYGGERITLVFWLKRTNGKENSSQEISEENKAPTN